MLNIRRLPKRHIDIEAQKLRDKLLRATAKFTVRLGPEDESAFYEWLESCGLASLLRTAHVPDDSDLSLRAVEKKHIIDVVNQCGNSRGMHLKDAARILNISRGTLYAKLKEYGFDFDTRAFPPPADPYARKFEQQEIDEILTRMSNLAAQNIGKK